MPAQNGNGPPKGGKGGGRKGGGFAAGPSGNCVCPSCGTKAPHSRGMPCNQMTCPQCGTVMTRNVS
ncbi:hypothetical protein ACFL60_06120 [Candidatus Omnitrophota bacterium]